MVAPRGGTSRGKPPLAPTATRQKNKKMNDAPVTVTKTPAHGVCTSPQHTKSTNAAASNDDDDEQRQRRTTTLTNNDDDEQR
jgi:hypothetical protein